MLSLFDRVAEQDQRLADQEDRLEKLERRLGQNCVNSSLPPSSDRGQGPKRPARKRSERKQGGQLGHEGALRKLVDDPDQTLAVRPDECRKCGHDLTGQGRVVGRAARSGRGCARRS
jgi:transposase